MASSPTRCRARLVPLTLLAILAAATTAEVGLRVVEPAILQPGFAFAGGEFEFDALFRKDQDLFWKLRPDVADYLPNELGTRGPLPPADRERQLRIFCCGDSITFGHGMSYEDSYPIRLERILQAKVATLPIFTIVGALPGWSSHQTRVLCEQRLATLRPDLTVVCLGAWNDYLPAIDFRDSEYAEQIQRERSSWWRQIRLVQLCRRALWASRPKIDADAVHPNGPTPSGRRVSLAEFAHNVEAIVTLARQHGSKVLLLAPVLPEATLRDVAPIANEYRAALLATAGRLGVDVVDACETFARYTQAPAPWSAQHENRGPCWFDTVHPTRLGNELYARALADAVLADPPPSLRAALAGGGVPPRTLSLEPSSVPFGYAGGLALRTHDGSPVPEPDRIWIGGGLVRRFQRMADGRIALLLPPFLPPGSHPIELLTRDGVVREQVPLSIEQQPLVARVTVEGERAQLVVESEGVAGSLVQVWASTSRREPRGTLYGAFGLDVETAAPPAGLELLPFAFPATSSVTIRLGDDGRGSGTFEVGRDAASSLCLQGLSLLHNNLVPIGALTEVLEVTLQPRQGVK